MPVLSNPKHERFAQELAKGKAQAAAYKAAGYKPSEHHASRLASHGKVRARVRELQSAAAKRTEVTIASLTEELDEARAIALEKGQVSAAVSATLGKAKLHGLGAETRRLTGPNGGPVEISLSNVTDDKLDAIEALLAAVAGSTGGTAEAGEGGEGPEGG